MPLLTVNKETVTVDLKHFQDLLTKYQQLSKIVQEIKTAATDQKSGTVSLERWGLPKLEIPDWLCGKQDFCVTTAGNKHWNIRECNVEAEIVCVSYGLKYGTPASMTKGRCEDVYPDDPI